MVVAAPATMLKAFDVVEMEPSVASVALSTYPVQALVI